MTAREYALQMLERHGLPDYVVEAFRSNGDLYVSSPAGLCLALHEFGYADSIEAAIRDVISERGIAYHVVVTDSYFGELLSILYIRDDQNFIDGYDDMPGSEASAYVLNVTFPDFSEYGSVRLDRLSGGALERTDC